MKRFIFASLPLALAFTGCAHPYSLQPITGKDSLATKKCVLHANYQESTPEEMLIRIKVLNRSEGPFDIDSSYFSLVGPPESLKESPLAAEEPEKYLKELNALAELQDARTQMGSYQGIDALGTLKGESSDRQIDSAKDLYREKQKEAETSRATAAALRKRIAMIQPVALRKTTLKSGETAEGAIIVKAAFKDEGVVTLESTLPACQGGLRFLLRK